MVIAKWIPFGAQQSAATVDTKPPPIPVVSSADAKKFGFENFGNTCYANSVLQALYFCAPFRELLLQSSDRSVSQTLSPPLAATPVTATPATAPQSRPRPQRKPSTSGATIDTQIASGSQQPVYPPIPSSPPTLFSALRSLFLYISKHPEDKGVVPPRAFIEKLKEVNELFRSTMHQDAHEFLNYLLNKIVEEIEEENQLHQSGTPVPNSAPTPKPRLITTNTIPGSSSNLVHRLFEGVLTSETKCLTCETVSSRNESFLDLSIDIEKNFSVTACLRQFSASEMLCQKNKFFCDSCCDLQEAEKRMKIKKLPNVLALHLKRFKYQEELQKYTKLAYRVAFPLELRLFNTVDDIDDADRLYELFAIVVHIGNGPHHGHYISLIKTLGSWFVFDDDIVDPIKESDIPKYFGDSNSGSAYVLYYQAVDIDLEELGLRLPAADPPEPSQILSTDLHSFSLREAPVLPPGLIEATESPEIGDPLLPATPSQTSSVPLKLNIPHIDDSSSSSASGGTSSIGSLFSSLRRGQSTKARMAGPSWQESRKSYSELSPRTATLPPLPALDDQPKMLPSSPLPPTPLLSNTNEKQRKESDRKANTWFKRKGLKLRSETGSEHSPSVPLPGDEDGSVPSPTTSSSPWFRGSGHTPKHSADEQNRRPPEPLLFDGHATQPFAPSPIQSAAGFTDGHRDRRNGYDSPSAGSASSSVASNSGAHPYKNVDFPKFSASSTNVYASPPGAPPSPHHKRSLSQLGQKRRSHNDPGASPTQLPPRPASAFDGAKGKSGRPSHPVPPVPSLPFSTPKTPVGNGTAVRRASEFDTVKGKGKDEAPGQQHDASGHGLGSFGGANSGASTTSSASSNLKRVSRKLSLTSPILGFGRKDKEKHKDRDKVPIPPSSFIQAGMPSRI